VLGEGMEPERPSYRRRLVGVADKMKTASGVEASGESARGRIHTV